MKTNKGKRGRCLSIKTEKKKKENNFRVLVSNDDLTETVL